MTNPAGSSPSPPPSRETRSGKVPYRLYGVFDGVKRSIVQPVSAKIYVPVVERKIAQVISIAGTTVQLMDVKDFEMFELNVTAEEAAGLEPGKEVAYIASLGKKKLE